MKYEALKIRYPFKKSDFYFGYDGKININDSNNPEAAIDKSRNIKAKGIDGWTLMGYFIYTGPGWGRYFVGPLQYGICYGAVIACSLLGGQSLKVSQLSLPPLFFLFLFSFFFFQYLGDPNKELKDKR